MRNKYKNLYADDNVYGRVVDIVKSLNLKDEGVHLDIACGYAAINTGLGDHKYSFDYIGIDSNEECVKYLNEKNLEAYQHTFTCNQDDFYYIEKLLKGRNLKLITVLDFLEHLPQPEKFLIILNKLCKKYNALLIVSVPNICHKDIAFKMMEGEFNYTEEGLLDKTHLSFFSAKRLEQCMNDAGFQQVACKDFYLEQSDQHFPSQSTFLANSTVVYQYFDYIKKLVDPFASVNQFIRAYVSIEKCDKKGLPKSPNNPFLSIVTRTQGTRIEALSETLLCLTAQTNTNFEVLIVGHKLTVERQIAVERVIEELPNWMRKKVRLIKVDHGNRTTPLNVGFEQANGEYVAILDDDDIVFDNWVEEFYNLSKKSFGATLHTFALLQKWEVINYNGKSALRAIGSPNSIYCTNFDLLNQLRGNTCPTMTYACPRYVFQKLGVRFNEELTTTEDWDFLMRTAFITGVENSSKVTSIYRIWENSQNSYSEHNEKEWQFNECYIKHQFGQVPIVLPKGYASKLFTIYTTKNNTQNATLYVNYGKGFSQNNSMVGDYNNDEHSWNFKTFKNEKVFSIRFDPNDEGMIWVSDIIIEIYTNNDTILSYKIDDAKSNGLKLNNGLLFLKPDPQIIVSLKIPEEIKNVKIKCRITSNIPEYVRDKVCIKMFSIKKENIFYKGLKNVYHGVRKIKSYLK